MHTIPRGIWMPDEMSVLQTALGILRKSAHRGIPEDEFETLVMNDLLESARDGCHDAVELACRCRAHLKDKGLSRR